MFYKLALLLFMFPHLTYGLACEKSFAKRNKYASYQEVSQYAIANKITGVRDWKSRKHPAGIPKYPDKYFKKRGKWQGWHVFLGKKYVSYEEAREYARSIGVTGVEDWKSREHPAGIPNSPHNVYGKQGKWTNWYDFLGREKGEPRKRQAIYTVSYQEARKYAIENNIKSIADWKSRSHPSHIPKNPEYYFQATGEWTSWYDFLGKRLEISYEEARQYAIENQIQNMKDWKSRKHPPHIPRSIAKYFQKQGKWTNWYDFLGKKKKPE